MVWEEEEVETTWQEVSTFYRYGLKTISCSSYDYPERGPVCYTWNYRGKAAAPAGSDFSSLIFQSVFYVQTTKGFNVAEIIPSH